MTRAGAHSPLARKMKTPPKWRFDEFQQVGRDYTSVEEVRVYDETHARFRDMVAEANRALDRMKATAGQVVLDMGSGTGVFALEASKRKLIVHAADVSKTMISYAKERTRGFHIVFHHAGFLTINLPGGSVDLITTTYAFHHLPDYWKGIALARMNKMLKRGGLLYLRDVIIEEKDSLENIEKLIARQEELGGDFLREDAEGHFRDEHSTYDWVVEGLLERAGFTIESKEFEGGLLGTYLCKKNENRTRRDGQNPGCAGVLPPV